MASVQDFPVYAVLPCSDFARARAWYAEKLGLEPTEEMTDNGWYRCGDGTWLLLTSTPNAGTARNTAAGFTVRGIEGVMEELRAQGVEFLEYDMGEMGRTVDGLLAIGPYKAAWFNDSEGNIVELSEVVAG